MELGTLVAIVLGISGYVVAGVLYVIGLFDKQRQDRIRADDTTATNLINNLRATTELQEKEIGQLRAEKIEQGREIAHLQGQIKTLTEVMQGRDPAMQSFLRDAPSLMQIVRENNDLSKTSAEALTKLTTAMTAFLKTAPHPA